MSDLPPTTTSGRVPVDHFDREGVQELARTMSNTTPRSQFKVPRYASNAPPVSAESIHENSASTVAGTPRDEKARQDIAIDVKDQEEEYSFERSLREFFNAREQSNVSSRSMGVSWNNLTIKGPGRAPSASAQPTIFSLLNIPGQIINAVQSRKLKTPDKVILDDFEGVVKPGEMLLVLGSPGSGCTTLLKALAAQLPKSLQRTSGEIKYDDLDPKDVETMYRGDIGYCEEDDVHFPTLSVHDTISFAAQSRSPASAGRVDGQSRKEHIEGTVKALTTVLGLTHVLNTPVGDAAIRGVSGGEKKRVSIAEALAARRLIGCWDNSTRGLDASTALEYAAALRLVTDIANVTTIVTIYQAGEALYEYFDKVTVLYAGRLIYFGSAKDAREYFVDMGWEPHPRQTTADFLVSVTDINGRTLREGFDRNDVPSTPDEMAAAFRASPEGKRMSKERVEYEHSFSDDALEPSSKRHSAAYWESFKKEHTRTLTRAHSAYVTSIPMQARLLFWRRVKIVYGQKETLLAQTFAYVFQAVITGTVFLKISTATSAYFSRGGVLFFSTLFAGLTSMAEIPSLFAQRPIVEKHSKAAMYHPYLEALALTVVDVPVTAIVMVVFSVVVYEIVQLQQSAGQFFIFYLFVLTATLAMKSIFRSVAAFFPAEAPAQAVAGVLVLILALYTGYTIPRPSMIGALRWLTWLNPLRYAFESMISNEFHTINGQCASLVPSGPGYETASIQNQVCSVAGSVPGSSTVNGNTFLAISYGFTYSNLWRNFGVVMAFLIGFIVILLVLSEYNTGVAGAVTGTVLFKRSSKQRSVESPEDVSQDAEKQQAVAEEREHEIEAAAKEQPKMDSVFSWHHLNYEVPVGHGNMRRLLDDVSGYVKPGKLTALMGESGAGKTTLLNVLADRQTSGVVTGNRFVNGQRLPKDFQSQTGYCQQTDTHTPQMTVRESLLFSARLRQPFDVPDAEKVQYVETCLKMCGLENYGDAVVGSLGVEHRKRVTIGVELAAKPKLLLFLDEPTSGLDSQSAWAIVTFLRQLADSGQAILCTIHQPSAELFSVFDRLLLLRKGGQTVYFGDVGKNGQTMIDYFQHNKSREIKDGENPAEFMLDVIGAGATAKASQDWHDVWKHSQERTDADDGLTQLLDEAKSKPVVSEAVHGEFATPFWFQFKELASRNIRRHIRDPTYLVAKFMLNIAGGLLIGFTFFKAKNTIQGTQNRLFAIFMSTILSVPLSNQVMVPFINTRTIYEIRERPSRIYHWAPLLAAQYVTELPWNIAGSILYFFCWYWTVAFPTSRAGYTFLMYCVTFPAYFTSIAFAVASMVPNAEIAGILFGVVFSFVLTFNGVLQPPSQLGWWRWMNYVTPYTYLIEGLLGQAIGGQELRCAQQEYVTVMPPSGQNCTAYLGEFISRRGGYLLDTSAQTNCQYCSAATTDQFMGSMFNIYASHHWRDYGIFVGYVFFNIFAMFLIVYVFRVSSPIASARRLTAKVRRNK